MGTKIPILFCGTNNFKLTKPIQFIKILERDYNTLAHKPLFTGVMSSSSSGISEKPGLFDRICL